MKSLKYVFLCLLFVSCAELNRFKPVGVKPAKDFFFTTWSKNLDPVSETGNLPISLQAPVIDDGLVFIGDNKGYMNAYELENGREVWRVFDNSSFHAKPIVYKEKLIYGTVQGRVIARNTKNGDEVLYNVDLGSPIETAGTVYNGKIFYQLRNHQIFCLDIETGKILWGFKKSVSYLTTLQRSSTPIIFDNKLFVGFADGTLAAINIDEGLLIYEVKLSSASKFLDVDATPVVFDGKIYIGPQAGNVVVVEPNSGKILRRAEFNSLRSPVVYNDKLIFGTNNGELVFCDKDLNVLNKVKVSSHAITSVVMFKNSFVVGNLKGELIAIDQSKLTTLGKFEFGHAYSAIFSDIVSQEGHLIILSSRNRLFTFN